MNEEVNKEISNYDEIQVLSNDFLYQEAVLDFIEKNPDIDFLLLNEELPGEKIEDFINKINKIKIILFVENKSNNIEKIIKENIYRIFTNGEKTVDEIIKIIKEENYVEKLEKEIENLKEIIQEKNNNKNNFKQYFEKIINRKENNHEVQNSKIICISGCSGIEKDIFTYIFAKEIPNKDNKTIIIDLDILNDNIHKLIQNKKIKIIRGKEILLEKNEKISTIKFEEIIKKIKKEYNQIIVNTSSECFYDINKKILEKSNKIIFIIENNIENIKKSKKLLEIYLENFNIKKEKFEIILNKTEKKENIYLSEIIGSLSINKNLEIKSINPNIQYKRNNIKKLIKRTI